MNSTVLSGEYLKKPVDKPKGLPYTCSPETKASAAEYITLKSLSQNLPFMFSITSINVKTSKVSPIHIDGNLSSNENPSICLIFFTWL